MTKPEEMNKLKEWLENMPDRWVDNIIANIQGLSRQMFEGYKPTSNPTQAYPLMLNARISLRLDRVFHDQNKAYILDALNRVEHEWTDKDPLVAAMKVYVLNYFGWNPKDRKLFLASIRYLYGDDPRQIKESL